MKRTLLVICLIMASLLPVQLTVAMEKGKERKATKKEKVEKEQSRLAFLARYFNFLSFNGKIAGIYFQDPAPVASDSDSDSDSSESDLDSAASKSAANTMLVKQTIEAALQSLRLEELPIRLKREGKPDKIVKLKRLFNCGLLKQLLITMSNDYFNDVRETPHQKAARYLESFKDCLRINAIKIYLAEHLKHVDIDLEKSLDALISYYKGNKKISIENCLSLEKFAELFGLNTFCRIDALRDTINALLQKKTLSKREILECLALKALLRHIGCTEKDLDAVEKAIPGMVAFGIDFAKKEEKATDEILAFFARYGKENKSAGSSKPHDDDSSSDSSKEDAQSSSK